jgi:hypothetical protein
MVLAGAAHGHKAADDGRAEPNAAEGDSIFFGDPAKPRTASRWRFSLSLSAPTLAAEDVR